MTGIHDLLDRAETELATLAATGLVNPGPATAELAALANALTAARLGTVGDRLREVVEAGDTRACTAAWAAAWTGVGLVRTRLLKPQRLEVGEVLALPQAPNLRFPRPVADLGGLDDLLTVLQGPDLLVRACAAGRLAELGDDAVPGLLAVQRRCGRCIRFLAIETLGRVGTRAALDGLTGLLGDADVARCLEGVLLGLRVQSVPTVARALAEAKDTGRRQAAAKLLWRSAPGEMLEPYLEDGDELVRGYAQAALWPEERLSAWGGPEDGPGGLPAAVALVERGLDPPESLVEPLGALSKNRLADAAAVLWHTRAESPLLGYYLDQMVEGRRTNDRERAAVLVRFLAHPEALAALLELLSTHPQLALGGLAELADSTTVLPLMRLAEPLAAIQRDPYLWALGRIGDPAAVPLILETLLEAPIGTTRDKAEKALAAIGAPAVPTLGQTLLHLGPSQAQFAPALERVLKKIRTPEATAALKAYESGTDELTRMLAYLADDREAAKAIARVAHLGTVALEPLLAMLAKGNRLGQANAALALGQLAPGLPGQERHRIIRTLTDRLRAVCRRPAGSRTGFAWSDEPVVLALVATLCELDASASAPELREALALAGTGQEIVRCWQKTQRPWLLEVIAQGLRAPDTRWHSLSVAMGVPAEPEALRILWPDVEAIVQAETEAVLLWSAVKCLRTWADPRAVPPLRALKKRIGSVTGHAAYQQNLSWELDAALAELDKRRSPWVRLRGR